MRSVIVLQHALHETLGTLEDFLGQAGLRAECVRLFREVPESLPLDRTAGLVIMGGPMNVDETDTYPFLEPEIRWIREALDRDLPTLGICLGSQLLAKSLGAKVYANGIKEIGWYDVDLTHEADNDPLLACWGTRAPVFQWHGDTFDLPRSAVHLASSKQCRHQAFRYGRAAWGLQFHVEMTQEMVNEWLSEPGNRQELAGLEGIDPAEIAAQTGEKLPAVQLLGAHVLERFATLCCQE